MINPEEMISFKDRNGEFIRYLIPEWSRRYPQYHILEKCLYCERIFSDGDEKFIVLEFREYDQFLLNLHTTLSKRIGYVCRECVGKFKIE